MGFRACCGIGVVRLTPSLATTGGVQSAGRSRVVGVGCVLSPMRSAPRVRCCSGAVVGGGGGAGRCRRGSVSAAGSSRESRWGFHSRAPRGRVPCRGVGEDAESSASSAAEDTLAKLSAVTGTADEDAGEGEKEKTRLESTLSNLDTMLDIKEETQIKKTVNNLNALLGIEDDVKEEPEVTGEKGTKEDQDVTQVGISPQALQKILEADKGNVDQDKKIEKMMSKMEKLSGEADDKQDELMKEFTNLVDLLTPESIPKEDLEIIKSKVFGYNTYWVTGSEPNPELAEGGWLFRGNLRAERDTVYKSVKANLESEFGGKYVALMAEEVDLNEDDTPPEAGRVTFVITLASMSKPEPLAPWQYGVGFFLVLLTLGSALQLGLVAQVSKLPAETLDFFSKPENREMVGDILPPGLENFDPTPYFDSALPITAAVLASAGLHELGHYVLAFMKDVKISPPFFIPNGQLGTFGAITQFRQRMPDRKTLFEVAAAGPIAGGSCALAIFLAGLVFSSMGGEDLVPVPSLLLNGSLLLGGLTKLVLGVEPSSSAQVMVHPMLIAGWCALTTTALNCLPVGCLDGGRVVQSAFGRPALAFTGLFTFLGLALGVLGSALSLPFGIYVLITQRNHERAPFDDVTPVDNSQSTLALALITFSLLTLLPFAAESDAMSTMLPL